MRLHHTALGAEDVARVARFYETFFGLTEITRHDDEDGELRSVWLDMAGTILMVERTTKPPRDETLEVDRGHFLIVFEVDEAQRSRLEDTLIAAGHAIDARTGYTSYTRDPEGNRVGFSTYPT